MAITAQKIAELAGVSRGTVDRALKNRPGVNPETKAKILKIAKEYNYKPNLIGKALVYSNRNIPVEVLMNSVGNSFFLDVKHGIFDAEKAYSDYGIQVHLTETKGYDEEEMLKRLSSLPPDVRNIIVTPIDSVRFAEKLQSLTEQGIQVITLSSDIENSGRISYVGCDYLKSGKIAGKLTGLISGGKAKLCIVTGSLMHSGHRQRVDGMKEILKNYPNVEICALLQNNDDDAIAYQKMKILLKRHPDIDFVYITAGGVNGTLRAIRECNKNIKVCSFDDTPTTRAALLDGTISATVCQSPYEQGYNAVKSIFDTVVAHMEIPEFQYSMLHIKVDQSIL